MKPDRHERILEIIAEAEVETQHQLLKILKERGVAGTQATISRDVRELRLVKELSPGGKYRYVVSPGNAPPNFDARLKTIFKESVTSCDAAGNLIVIKTLPGLASAACSALDNMSIPGLAGTIAGDDTAFIAMRDSGSVENLCREIMSML